MHATRFHVRFLVLCLFEISQYKQLIFQADFPSKMSAAITWRTFVRRIENMDFESKMRMVRRYPKRRLAIIIGVVLFVIFIFSRGTSSGTSFTKQHQCSAEKLKLWEKEIDVSRIISNYSYLLFFRSSIQELTIKA